MTELAIQASANGFLLGLQVAERLNGLGLGSTLRKEDELIDLILGLADGQQRLIGNSDLLDSLPGSADLQTKQTSLQAAMQQAAVRLTEWYRRQCGMGC
jgi:hypothetical protein